MTVLIVEDETAAALNLQALLAGLCPEAVVLDTCESVEESVAWLTAHPAPDLILMDIHLADGDAFRIFDRVVVTSPIIFTTAYDAYALDAFRVYSIDYLLKPIREEELRRALDKFRRMMPREAASQQERLARLREHERRPVFLVQVRDRITPLPAERIAYCYTAGERVTAYDFEGGAYPLDRTLEALSAELPPEDFFRANRQFIIARKALHDLSVWFGSRLALNLSIPVPERIVVSKARVPVFKRWLTGEPL